VCPSKQYFKYLTNIPNDGGRPLLERDNGTSSIDRMRSAIQSGNSLPCSVDIVKAADKLGVKIILHR
jgi:hypothetical protein